jgi:RNA polymerase sigma-70 factor (ECF subfamily)
MQNVSEPEDVDDESPSQLSELYHRALSLVRTEFEDATWMAFWRVVVDGQSPALVAQELGVSAAAIRQAKSRILRRLKQEVGELIQ